MALALRTKDPFRTVHVGALALCAVFLPWSEAFLSIAQMVLVANWIAEGIVVGGQDSASGYTAAVRGLLFQAGIAVGVFIGGLDIQSGIPERVLVRREDYLSVVRHIATARCSPLQAGITERVLVG